MWEMVSTAKASNPPLSKNMFLQTQEHAQDCWENEEADEDHEGNGEADNSSDEDN
jgi:hypothetical protein